MKYMYIVHRLVLTISKQQDLHPGHRRYYRPRTKEEEQLIRRIQFTVKSPETRLMSPETYCQVARKAVIYVATNFIPLNNILKHSGYTFIVLVSSQ